MRAALLFVALFGLVALAAAQSTYTYGGLKGTLYTDTACSAGSQSITFTATTSITSTPCITVGSGSGATAVVANAYCYSYSGVNYWYLQVYGSSATYTAACPTGSTGVPSTYATYAWGSGSDFSTCTQLSTSYTTAPYASFKPSGCSSASTLVVPSVLLVALAYVASKLSL
jgi:hypothetical protein